jgi:hypothetical protein
VRQRRGYRSLRQQAAQRFTLVKPERGDVDQARDVRRIRAQGGHDLAAVGVPGDDGGAVLEVQHLAQPGHVVGQRGQRELGRGDMVTVGLQAFDDVAPARALGPCAVDENDIRSGVHLADPFEVVACGRSDYAFEPGGAVSAALLHFGKADARDVRPLGTRKATGRSAKFSLSERSVVACSRKPVSSPRLATSCSQGQPAVASI